ncbi:MAG: enoyl-CoA hydratase/isomerase family protein, partial [Planctomycetes bacterium]|nr:enoyl-CoA hydratase/isomerase family protein [Planctomycetota bacterium]
NLLGLELFQGLNDALDEVAADANITTLVLRGAGERAFSAGVDLHEMRDLTPQTAEEFIRTLHRAIRKVLTLPIPAIAAINGPCLGGALELVLACDMRIASEDSIFGLPEVLVGVPSVIEASLLPKTVGLGRARRLIMTGDSITSQEALDMGLVDRVVPKDAVHEAALEAAEKFRNISPQVLATQKDIIVKWLELGDEQAAEYSIKAFALGFTSSHPQEAMSAFLEKREPQFKS